MATAPCFITNHELDRFLGGGQAGQRQRLRLLKSNLLPVPADLGRVRRFNIMMFPRFALAGLVRDLGAIPKATDAMAKVTTRTFSVDAFVEVREALRDSALVLDAWSFDSLVGAVADRAPDALSEWTSVVEEAQQELAERLGISFVTDFGIVERTIGDAYVIAIPNGRTERVPATRCAAVAEKGRAVALERVRVMAKEQDYVMPLETTPDKEDRELADWFTTMMEPAAQPVAAVVAEPSHHERLPYTRSSPRRARWHGASTMTRLPAAR
jgi:hypothetical protein